MRKSYSFPWAHPITTGEDLARDAVDDFAKFFKKDRIEIPIIVDDVEFAVTRGAGRNTQIVISRGMAAEVIHSPTVMFFHLLIIGHEIAHVVQLHNDCPWHEGDDSRSLEMWADFYGSKVMMCLVTFGGEVSKLFKSFFPSRDFGQQLDHLGNAVGLLTKHVYNNSKNYPHILTRIGCVQNGVHSFLRKELKGHPDGWQISLIVRIMASKPVHEAIILFGDSQTDETDDIERSREWHIKKQDHKLAITPGFSKRINMHLNTSFIQSEEELELRRKASEEELIESGILARSSDGNLCLGPGPKISDD
ncbi:hypothetical protein [Gluconobacter cerinus]|uniref:hypothetical protein n=1 Tax=Gluconobacter cerinus TaxID=38307 RepID=UPI001B8B7909|nr:hypothetical protein [Gluconobacter cerinus]MBS1035411.1 hypothetical protein [Gluconobacter cerinus]